MPILFDKEGKAYEVGTYQEVNVEDYRADLARLEDEYQDRKKEIQSKIDFLTATEPIVPEEPAAPEAPAAPEFPLETVGVINDPQPSIQPAISEQEQLPTPETNVPSTAPVDDPAPQVIQDVTPAPVVTVDESAPLITVTESTPEVTTVEDASPTSASEPEAPAQPVVITLQ